MSEGAVAAGGIPKLSRGTGRLGLFVLSVALLAAAVALGLVAARGASAPKTLQDRVRSVASSLRCPVCQDLSVADSPSGLAQQMRATITRDLQAGRTPDEIRASFVSAYGQWILLSPPRQGLGLVAWVLPALFLVVGVAAAGLAIRRWSVGRMAASPDVFRSVSRPEATISLEDRHLLERALRDEEDDPE
jgi:cytochrome c-type biogenesis protein CcmH